MQSLIYAGSFLKSVKFKEKIMRFLFLYVKDKCYDSFYYFEKCIASALQQKGHSVRMLAVDDKKPLDALLPLTRSVHAEGGNMPGEASPSYDCIADMGAALPLTKDKDGKHIFNLIPGIKLHYILDHPMYHNRILSAPIDDMTVCCIDRRHEEFVRKYYPHIKSVFTAPLGAVKAKKPVDYNMRNSHILFTGTYSSPEITLKKARELDGPYKLLWQPFVNELLEMPSLTQEEALIQVIKRNIQKKPASDSIQKATAESHFKADSSSVADLLDHIPSALEKMYTVDVYLRALLREEMLLCLLRQSIHTDVYGFGWDFFKTKLEISEPKLTEFLHIYPMADYENMPALYASYKYSLNQMPWFKDGLHDRIPLSMMNGCLCISDSTPYMTKTLKMHDMVDYLDYSIEDMEKGALKIKRLVNDEIMSFSIAQKGQDLAKSQMTFSKHADLLLDSLSQIRI